MTPAQIKERCRELVARGTKPTLPEVRPMIDAWYALPGYGAGGPLHGVLDDHNYERCHIRWSIDNAERYYPEYDAELTRCLGSVLLMLSNSQRRKM